jgi:gliding motility-associated-like protein
MRFKKFFSYTFILLFFISLFSNSASAATFSFNTFYKGSGGPYNLNSKSITGLTSVSGTSIQFYQAGAQFSGNSINGILTYYDNNNQLKTIYGNLNRQDKSSGNVSQAFYFIVSNAAYTTYTGEAYLFIVPGKESLYSNGMTVSTSSDPMDAALNAVVASLNSITISSSAGTDSQTVCVNSSITSITYSTTVATGATFSGLPTGVNGLWSSNRVTISGTPTVAGTFNYTVTLTGGSNSGVAKGTITSKINTISLSSIAGTDAQTVIENNPIDDITYNTTNATGATITGLPTGVTGSFTSNVVTITGSPITNTSTTSSGEYTYIVSLTGGCGVVSKTGTIIVNAPGSSTIRLSSALGTNDQNLCINTNISSITYSTTGGSVIGANFSGLPSGVIGNYGIGGIVTISGTPTVSGTFNYKITLDDGVGKTSASGRIVVKSTNTILLSSNTGTDSQSPIVNNYITDITYSTTGATNATITGLPTGVNGSWSTDIFTISGAPSASVSSSTSYNYVVTTSGGCGVASATGIIDVNPIGLNTIVLSSNVGTNAQNICANSSITSITYTTTSATDAEFSGLPAGITGDWSSNRAVISGTPTGTFTSSTVFNYTVTLIGGSGTGTATGTITINPISVAGSISGGGVSVCSDNTNSTTLTLNNYAGSIQWQSSSDNSNFNNITGANGATYTASNVTNTSYYRAIVTNGSCSAVVANSVSITSVTCITAKPDNNTTSVNIPVSGNVATNDVIAAETNYGTPTAFTTNPSGATITMDAASGNYTFTTTKPGKYEFYVPVCGAGQTSNCQLTLLQITVLDPTIPNNLPVANADIATTSLNTAVTTSVLNNDKSGNIGTDLVPSSVSIVTQPVNGTAVANSDGTITYTPTSGFSGNDSLVYKVCDNATPANCQTTLVYYKVLSTGASSVTSAIDDYAFVNNNKTGTASVSGNVLSNDKNTAGSALTASLVTGPTAAQGTLTFNTDGSFTFVPALGFNGPIDVVYNACTGDSPAVCAKATLHIVVNPPPTINPDFNSTNINTPVPGSINTNDIIPAGTTYGTPISSTNNPSGATISINAATGTYTFTASKPGKYIFNVPVCAASQTTGCPISPLQITVLDPNITTNPPVANNDYSVTQLNTPVVTTILANDKPGNINTSLIPTSIVINTAPKNGTATANKATSKSGSSSGIKSFSTNGTITYTPNPGFVGLDSLLYTVCDNANPANCEIATVYYTISTATPNNVLVANDDYNTSVNRVPATGNVLLNDDYGGAALTASLITGPLSSQGVFALIADGSYSFTPAFGFTGPVDIIYQACSGTTCINATLHILVNLVPPPPPTVINATYVAGSKSNPTSIKSLVTVTPTGTTLQWCDPTGVTCSSTPPTIPNLPGTYIWCVKSIDTVTQLSSTCAMDTVIILAPYTVMEVTKTVRSVQSNPDGSVLLTFVLKASNKTNAVMDSVSVVDDLTQTFKVSSGFTVAALDVYGGLVKNSTYDGISNINLVTNQSKIAANSMDSAILKVLVASPDIFGSLTNTAVLGGKTKYGYVSVNSNDPLANPTDTTKRVPTGFNVPKADLVIAGGFSPNFDGYNDKWIIVRPFGTRVEVKVFNRWGNIVYQNADYKNDWNGIGSTNFMGQDVPDGTYFYIVNAVEPSGTIKKFTSSLTIVR